MVGAHQLQHSCPGLCFGERAFDAHGRAADASRFAVRLDPGAPERPHNRLPIPRPLRVPERTEETRV